ncbi:MAG: mechanosensitive ion channel family protein [Acidobacteriota bacterium]
MSALARLVAANGLERWVGALLLAAATFVLLLAMRWFMIRALGRVAQRTTTLADDLALHLVRSTRSVVLLTAAVWAGSLLLDLAAEQARGMRALAVVVLIFQGGLWGAKAMELVLTEHVARRRGRAEHNETTLPVVTFVGRLALWSVVALLILANLGIDVTALVAGMGVGGVAIALATQRILGDLFASLSIALDEPFEVGDFIVIGEFAGTVERVGIKTTRVRSLSGEQLVFANADLLNSQIRNFKRMQERRVVFSLGVTYQTAAATLAEIPSLLEEIVRRQERARFDRAHFRGFGDSAIEFEIVYYVLEPDYNLYMDVQQAINLEIFGRFAERGIEFAYPTQTLFVASGAAR